VASKNNKSLDLEKAMAELEKIVAQLESGDLSLEKSLQQFEKGVRLSRECQAALNEAEQKVQILMDGEPQDTSAEELSSVAN
jgi:exodeoxyribonuclease VII small subunit